MADILSALSAAKLLADANPSDATLDNLACDLEDGPFAETARLLAGRTKTIVPERLDALVREVLGDSRPAMDSDEEEEDEPAVTTSAKTCGAHDALALLALRLGGLSSLEAMSCVWATFLEALRSRWDANGRFVTNRACLNMAAPCENGVLNQCTAGVAGSTSATALLVWKRAARCKD